MWQNHQDLIALGKQGKDMEVHIKCASLGLQNAKYVLNGI